MNESKHHDFLSQLLDEWYYKNRLELNLPNEKFIEGTDYKLTLLLNQGSEEAVISCACGIRINLPKERMNFSLSNYYKHIRQTKCIMMKNKIKSISRNTNDDDDDDEDDETSQQETLETDVVNTSTTTSSNITASNNQSCSTSKKRTKSPSHNDYSRKIRQRS
ncbi:unnamed protein product [Rotaria socialis]